MLALLKETARMSESILFDKKDKTIPSNHDNPFRFFKCASYALKWMDEVINNYFGEPPHLTKCIRVDMIPFIVSTQTPKSK